MRSEALGSCLGVCADAITSWALPERGAMEGEDR